MFGSIVRRCRVMSVGEISKTAKGVWRKKTTREKKYNIKNGMSILSAAGSIGGLKGLSQVLIIGRGTPTTIIRHLSKSNELIAFK